MSCELRVPDRPATLDRHPTFADRVGRTGTPRTPPTRTRPTAVPVSAGTWNRLAGWTPPWSRWRPRHPVSAGDMVSGLRQYCPLWTRSLVFSSTATSLSDEGRADLVGNLAGIGAQRDLVPRDERGRPARLRLFRPDSPASGAWAAVAR